MRKLIPAAAVAALAAAALLAACKAQDGAEGLRAGATQATSATQQATPQKAATPHDDVRRVTVAELQKMLEAGEAVVVDVRSKASYDGGHIRGSLSIPRDQLVARVGELPKDKLIVFYCA